MYKDKITKNQLEEKNGMKFMVGKALLGDWQVEDLNMGLDDGLVIELVSQDSQLGRCLAGSDP